MEKGSRGINADLDLLSTDVLRVASVWVLVNNAKHRNRFAESFPQPKLEIACYSLCKKKCNHISFRESLLFFMIFLLKSGY